MLNHALSQQNLGLSLGMTGVVQFSEEGFALKINREHPDWNLPWSPYYVNFRLRGEESKGPLEEWQAEMFGQHLAHAYHAKLMRNGRLAPFQVIGIPNTGVPLAKGFVEAWPIPGQVRLLQMRKEGKGKGVIMPDLVGDYDPALPIRLIDDVLTKGGSKRDTLGALGDKRVDEIIILVDREQGGEDEMSTLGLKLFSATTFSRTLETCRELGMISPEMHRRCVEYPALLDLAIAFEQAKYRRSTE